MSEEQNVETTNKIYEAFGRGDIGYIVDQLADDVHWFSYVDPVVPHSGDWSGKSKVPGFFQAIADGVDVSSFTPTEIYADGETVVSTGGFGGKSRPAGKEFQTQWVFIWKFADNLVVSYEQFHDWQIAAAFR
jgi:uncharacterized protein